jgi:hypothetical protein
MPSLNNFYSGKIHTYEAFDSCRSELNEIEQIIKANEIDIDTLELDQAIKPNLSNVWKELMNTVNNVYKIPDRIARQKSISDFMENIFKINLKVFPVNVFRISIPTYSRSQVSWHQDSQTWPGIELSYPSLKGVSVVTLWNSLTASDEGNGLTFALENSVKRFEHEFAEGQGYFNAKLDEKIKKIDTIFGPPFSGVIFGQDILHRSAVGSNKIRISLDLRFYHD